MLRWSTLIIHLLIIIFGEMMIILSFSSVEIVCDEPEISTDLHLSYTMTGTSYLSEINVTCQKGYRAENETSQLMCNASGTWEGDLPICVGNLSYLIFNNNIFY